MLESLKSWMESAPDLEKESRWISYIHSWEDKIHSLLSFDGTQGKTADLSLPFSNVPFAVKDNIAVKGFPLTCGSKILKPLKSAYSATAVERLQAKGARVVGKTNLDEFGMGSSCDNSALLKTSNPFDVERVAGGSSGGSAAAVAAGLVPFALGSDTGGSVRQPAAFCGVYGLKPTYGAVSRYGLVAYASSLDVVGILAREAEVLKAVFDTIKGYDQKDQTSIEAPDDFPAQPARTVAMLTGLSDLEPETAKAYQNTAEILRNTGLNIVEVSMPVLDYVVPAYYTIATAEASSNLARYTGIRYGLREQGESLEEMVIRTRTNGFGDEVKLRILLGTYVLRSGFQDQYYIRAQKIRTAIREGFAKVFKTADLLLCPVFPVRAFRHGDSGMTPMQQKLADKFTASANMAGIPAVAFPADIADGLPIGMQLLAPERQEALIFDTLMRIKDALPSPMPDGFSCTPWKE